MYCENQLKTANSISKIINWISNIKSKFLRKTLHTIVGIDKRAILPKYNSETFTNYFKNNNNLINIESVKKDRKVVIY